MCGSPALQSDLDERLAAMQSGLDEWVAAMRMVLHEQAAVHAAAVDALDMRLASRLQSLGDELTAGSAAALDVALAQFEPRLEELRSTSKAEAATFETQVGEYIESVRRALVLEIDRTRSRLAVPDTMALELERLRSSSAYADFYAMPEPLVSIPIATYNRAGLLVDRSSAVAARPGLHEPRDHRRG